MDKDSAKLTANAFPMQFNVLLCPSVSNRSRISVLLAHAPLTQLASSNQSRQMLLRLQRVRLLLVQPSFHLNAKMGSVFQTRPTVLFSSSLSSL